MINNILLVNGPKSKLFELKLNNSKMLVNNIVFLIIFQYFPITFDLSLDYFENIWRVFNNLRKFVAKK